MMDANNYSTRILDNIGDVLDYQRKYEESKKRGGYSDDYYLAQYNEYIKYVKKLLKEGKEKYDLLIKTIDDFKKGKDIDIF